MKMIGFKEIDEIIKKYQSTVDDDIQKESEGFESLTGEDFIKNYMESEKRSGSLKNLRKNIFSQYKDEPLSVRIDRLRIKLINLKETLKERN